MRKVAIIINQFVVNDLVSCYKNDKETFNLLLSFVEKFEPLILLPDFDYIGIIHYFYNPEQFKDGYPHLDSVSPVKDYNCLSALKIETAKYKIADVASFHVKNEETFNEFIQKTYELVSQERADKYIFIDHKNKEDIYYKRRYTYADYYPSIYSFINDFCKNYLTFDIDKVLTDFEQIIKSKPDLISDLKFDKKDYLPYVKKNMYPYDALFKQGNAYIELTNKNEPEYEISYFDFDINFKFYIKIEVTIDGTYDVVIDSPDQWEDEMWEETHKEYIAELKNNNEGALLEEFCSELAEQLRVERDSDLEFYPSFDTMRAENNEFEYSTKFRVIADGNKISSYEELE